MAVEVGKALKGRYELLRLMGKGAIASVYLALDKETNEVVAVKIMSSVADEEGRFSKLFRREAKLLNELRSPHIVKIYDFGVEEDTLFIVMEYVPGKTVAAIIRERGQMPLEESLGILRQVAEGLQATSQAGIIHRDLKPANIMVTFDGVTKIMDFGIATSVDISRLTDTGFLGTPYYISPEQAEGRQVDIRSDIYSLGVVLYEMLTGRVLFDGNSPIEIVMKHITTPPPPLSMHLKDIPIELETLLHGFLAKNPLERFQTPRELISTIDALLARRLPTPTPLATVSQPGALGADRVKGQFPSKPSHPSLLILEVPGGPSIPLDKETIRIGRSDERSGIKPDVDLSPMDPGRTISRRHARIVREKGQWFIQVEVGVRNPNANVIERQGARLKLPPGEKVPLEDNDKLRLGSVRLTFRQRPDRSGT